MIVVAHGGFDSDDDDDGAPTDRNIEEHHVRTSTIVAVLIATIVSALRNL